jgi:hypothetical protein
LFILRDSLVNSREGRKREGGEKVGDRGSERERIYIHIYVLCYKQVLPPFLRSAISQEFEMEMTH